MKGLLYLRVAFLDLLSAFVTTTLSFDPSCLDHFRAPRHVLAVSQTLLRLARFEPRSPLFALASLTSIPRERRSPTS